MDGLNRIQEHIQGEARERVAELEARLKAERDALLAETEAECQKLEAKAQAEAEQERQQILARQQSNLETLQRRQRLIERQTAVDKALEMAVAKLAQQPAEQRLRFLQNLVQAAGLPRGEVSLGKSDLDLRADLAKALGPNYTVAEKAAPIMGGLLVTDGAIVENRSIDLLLRNKRADLTALAADLLFK